MEQKYIKASIVYCFKQIGAFCKREFAASQIIAVLFILIVVGWMTTFMSERSNRVNDEMQRDSISYELSRYTGK